MPEKCYEKLVSNLILSVSVAIFTEYSRVEDWKSGHRKLNSLAETFSIQDTILDRILLKTNLLYQDTVSIRVARLTKQLVSYYFCSVC